MDNITVGLRVKSFDFEFDKTTYVDGIVVEVNCDELNTGFKTYKIRVDRQIVDGVVVKDYKAEGIEHFVFPPMNGTPTIFGRECNFVHPFDE